jgi:hypothetical protein
MSSQQRQITIDDLRSNWEADASIDHAPERMPPWNEVCSGLPWKPFCRPILSARLFKEQSFFYPGVYRLIGLASCRAAGDARNEVAGINRACGQDTTGTLYIGRGRPLGSRLHALRRSLRRGSPEHGAPETLRYYARLNQNFPPNKLAIAVLRCFKCEYAEGDLLDAYINSFGEIPPLNLRWD